MNRSALPGRPGGESAVPEDERGIKEMREECTVKSSVVRPQMRACCRASLRGRAQALTGCSKSPVCANRAIWRRVFQAEQYSHRLASRPHACKLQKCLPRAVLQIQAYERPRRPRLHLVCGDLEDEAFTDLHRQCRAARKSKLTVPKTLSHRTINELAMTQLSFYIGYE